MPKYTKDNIDKYNFIPQKMTNIISPGMKEWQLDATFDFYKKYLPEHLLAMKVKESFFNAAIEIGLTFLIPENMEEFSLFIRDIESVTKIKLEVFDSNSKDVKCLLKIRDNNFENKENIIIEALFRKYCYQIYKVLSKDDEETY